MAGQRTLTPSTKVRILVPQPIKIKGRQQETRCGPFFVCNLLVSLHSDNGIHQKFYWTGLVPESDDYEIWGRLKRQKLMLLPLFKV